MKDAEPSPELQEDPPVASTAQGRADRDKLAANAFERTLMPMIMTDPRQPDSPIVLANSAFLKMSGYSADEVLGRNPRFMQGEGSSRAAIAQIRAAIEEQRESRVEVLNGSTIATGLVSHELQGKIEWAWQTEGLSLILKVPALRRTKDDFAETPPSTAN